MIFNRILVPLDGSAMAERALVPALALAEAMSAKLFFIRVAIPLSLNLDPNFYQRFIELRQHEAKQYLQTIQPRFSSTPVEIETQVIVGRGAKSIINYAKENDIDLIVISSHGGSGINRWIYGTVADKVLHNAPCAIVLIHSQEQAEPFTLKRILLPLDGSAIAEQALEPALALAEAALAELLLLRVTTVPQVSVQPVPGWPGFEAIRDAAENEANAYLKSVQAVVAKSSVPTSLNVISGAVAEDIIDVADGHKVDLIIMCSHGLSGIERWAFGSVSERVLRGANCATMVIRGQEISE
jgi:nucleotide-binding universal stress UspA family protein